MESIGSAQEDSGAKQSFLTDALAQMQSALDLLDLGQAPDDIGAHLDLAISRLLDELGEPQEDPWADDS